jgi:hypothetical protein
MLGALAVLCSDGPEACAQAVPDVMSETRSVDSNSPRALPRGINNYKNLASHIEIQVKDSVTGRASHMVLPNKDFAFFLASERGLATDKLGRFADNAALRRFLETDYVDYMVRNDGKPLEINLGNFENFYGRSHYGSEQAGKKHVQGFIFSQPMTFDQLGVRSEKELIARMFEFNRETGRGVLKGPFGKYSSEAAFLAMLIELGYEVEFGDVVPILYISKRR